MLTFQLQPQHRRLLKGGKPVAIGARAFDVLLALAERRERVVTKTELLDLAWPGLVVEENNLQVQISNLRRLLGTEAIKTIPGRGYRLTQPLVVESPSQENGAPLLPGDPAAQTPPALIGRDDELQALGSLVLEQALVTVVGAGGMGKTVLALAAAQGLRPSFRDGICVVELASISDPALLLQAVAQALKIMSRGPELQRDEIVGWLASQSLLLVLDNCEHLVDAAGRLAATIAADAAGVRVLATSRERLNVPGEKVFALDPLQVPPVDHSGPVADFSAVRLFVERARSVQPSFHLDVANADAVIEICRQLDGMPLAIELAAARVRLLGAHGLRDHLDARFKVLVGGARMAAPRQQTLAATMDWSHAMLSPDEQKVLRRLGVFVGGCSLELAQQVASDDELDRWAVLDALSGLVDKSLVTANDDDPPRYLLLETVRAYAIERLAEHGETEATRRRHTDAVRDLFVSTEEARFGEHGSLTMEEFLKRLAPEVDNLRAAFDWAITDRADIGTAIELAASSAILLKWLGLSQESLRRVAPLRHELGSRVEPMTAARFWSIVPYVGEYGRLARSEVMDAIERAVSACRAVGDRRRIHQSLGSLAWWIMQAGETERATAICAEMQALESPFDPHWVPADRLNVQANILMWQRNPARALELLEAQRKLLLSAQGEDAGLIVCESNLCGVLNSSGRFEEAEVHARAICESADDARSMSPGYAMFQLLYSQIRLGKLDAATVTVRESMRIWRRDGLLLIGCNHLAALLAAKGQYENAARLDGAALLVERRNGLALSHLRQQARQHMLDILSAANVNADDIALWRVQGEALTEADIADICLKA